MCKGKGYSFIYFILPIWLFKIMLDLQIRTFSSQGCDYHEDL